jgi:mRNA-degrading endonuclease RelE of RelBE toxin-antitoxin system
LPEKIGAACVEFIFGPLADNPHRLGHLLTGPMAGLHSARRGSYRIVYRIDEESQHIDIVHVDHRGDVYHR